MARFTITVPRLICEVQALSISDLCRSAQLADAGGELSATEFLADEYVELGQLVSDIQNKQREVVELMNHLKAGHRWDGESGFCTECGWDGNA